MRDQNGQIIDMTGATAQSQLRTPDGTKIADLSVTLGDGAINIRYYGETGAWPLGKTQIDVLVTTSDGLKTGTDISVIEIVKGVTQ